MLKEKAKEHAPGILAAAVISGAVTAYGIWSTGETAHGAAFADASRMLVECQRIIGELQDDARSTPYPASQREAYRALLDSVPFVAWVKQYDPKTGQFRMWIINDKYSRAYGIARHEYEGKTDIEAWGADQQNIYQKNDFLALRGRNCVNAYEPDSQRLDTFVPVTKCYMSLGDDEYIVGFAPEPLKQGVVP